MNEHSDNASIRRAVAGQLFFSTQIHVCLWFLAKNKNARRFYEDEALRGGWSVRQIDRRPAFSRFALDTLPNKVMAREYQLALPAVKKLEAELAATQKRLERAAKK